MRSFAFSSTLNNLVLAILTWSAFLLPSAVADVGIVSFWVPEMYALLEQVRADSVNTNATIEEYIFGARKFYVTQYRGHNVVLVNTGVGISNAAATVAIMLQKFPTIDRVVGSGIAGGIVSQNSSVSSDISFATISHLHFSFLSTRTPP